MRVAAENNGSSDVQLTLEPIEPIKKTYHGVHVLEYLQRVQLDLAGQREQFKRAVKAAQIARFETLPNSP